MLQEGYSDEDDAGGVLRIGGVAIRIGGDDSIRGIRRGKGRQQQHSPELGSPGKPSASA